MAPILTLSDVSKSYNGGPHHLLALSGIDLKIQEGEFFMFVGPSGCGKSTLLRIMSGLEEQTHGTVTLKKGITRDDMSFVFQNFALLPWLTVAENIEMGLVGRGVPLPERMAIVRKELDIFGLKQFRHCHPHDLSGGMRQRVGIARAFASNPSLLFMDEPFSELDSFTAEELRQELLNIWKERGTTIVMVTHIVEEAIELADRIAVMQSSPGRIEKIFINRLPRPRNKRSADFFTMEDAIYSKIR